MIDQLKNNKRFDDNILHITNPVLTIRIKKFLPADKWYSKKEGQVFTDCKKISIDKEFYYSLPIGFIIREEYAEII